MTPTQRRGLELILRHPPVLGGYSDADLEAARRAHEWIIYQLDLSKRRHTKRGKYKKRKP